MIDETLKDCPICGSFQVSRWTVGNTVQCNACGCNAPSYTWQNRLYCTSPSDGSIYAATSRRDAMRQVLQFLESIEGAGYGGMAEFEIARSTILHEVEMPLGQVGHDFLTRLLVATDPHLQPLITKEMVEAAISKSSLAMSKDDIASAPSLIGSSPLSSKDAP